METRTRTLAKAVTWQALGLVTMVGIGLALTGSVATAGGFATLSAASGLVSYVVHERIWQRVRWGLTHPAPPLWRPREDSNPRPDD